MVLVAVASLATFIGPALARSCHDELNDEEPVVYTGSMVVEGPTTAFDEWFDAIEDEDRLATDQRAALLRWCGNEWWRRRRQYRADHSLHDWLAYRTRPLVLSAEEMGAIHRWRGPRGPPRTRAPLKN
jgi:hypothetical protein